MSTEPEFPALGTLCECGHPNGLHGHDEGCLTHVPDTKDAYGWNYCECGKFVAAVPATPAPESPAPAPRLCIGCGHDERVPVQDAAHPNALACCPDHDYRTPAAAARYARDLVPDARALVESWILEFLRTEPAPEVGTDSETSPDAGASIREAWLAGCKWGRDDSHCGEHSVSADPEEVEAALREFLAKPAEQREAEQTPHPVAEAEQSPQPAGGLVWMKEKPTAEGWYWLQKVAMQSQCVRVLVWNGKLQIEDSWSDHMEEVGKCSRRWQWAGPIPEPLAQAPTRNAGKGE